jgi:hypothetical protein
MPLSRATAQALMTVVVECGAGLFAALPSLEAELTADELSRMRREIARVISVMDEAISAKIAAAYPDLAPEAVPTAHKL